MTTYNCNNTLNIIFLIVLINIVIDILKPKLTRMFSPQGTEHKFCKHDKQPSVKYNISAKNAFTRLQDASDTQNLLLSSTDGSTLSTKSLKDIYDAIEWARDDAKIYAKNYTDGIKRTTDNTIATKAATSWVNSQLGTKINEDTANGRFLYKGTPYNLDSTNTSPGACLSTDKEDLDLGGNHDQARWIKKGWEDHHCVKVKLF